MTRPLFGSWPVSGALVAGVLVLAPCAMAAGQGSDAVSRPVVQALPPPAASDLNTALMRLARNPEDAGALVDAGNASLKVGDIEAAIGFFSRADILRPGNARAKAGLGSAHVRSENPFDALLMFEEAEKAGIVPALIAGDRGLAYDLVGDSIHAQELYRLALSQGPDDEVTRRLAISLAISGDRAGAEGTLRPLLDRRDLAAYRTRAFVMAILGDTKEALSIARVRLSPQTADALEPYLRYMPRLTAAQQAAAANFGHFPKAADIGRDDPRIASRGPGRSRKADSALKPQGEPLGGKLTYGKRETRAEARRRLQQEEQARQAEAKAAEAERLRIAAEERARAEALAKARAEEEQQARAAAQAREQAAIQAREAARLRAEAEERSQAQALAQARAAAAERERAQALAASAAPPPPTAPSAPPVGSSLSVSTNPPVQSAPVPVPGPSGPEPSSVAEAFADFKLAPGPARPAAGAVDLAAIQPPRDPRPEPKVVEEPSPKPKPRAEPPKPVHPSRVWAQIATGRDRAALAFDWRRMTRNAPDAFKGQKPFVAKWGQTNRMVVGPFPNAREAQAYLTTLKAADISGFVFTSQEGELVEPLPLGR